MPFFDQADYDIRCEWGSQAIGQLVPTATIIVVDVLSFSTCVDVAVGRGVTVLPYRWKDERAATYAREQNAELASRRDHIAGKYSLAPSCLLGAPAGLRLVLPSPNGSQLAYQARALGAPVVAGCLRNASAVARWTNRVGGPVAVIPAGERWPDGSLRVALEDLLGAGAIIRKLAGSLSPEAQTARAAFTGAEAHLHEVLLHSASGRELAEKGFAEDVGLAATLDASSAVPLLTDQGFVDATSAP